MKLLTLTSFLSLNLITGVNYCYSEMESNASKKVKSPSLVKRMPPIPSFIPKRMPKPSLPSATPPFVNLPSAFIKRMPKPFKTSVRWSDFKYNSPEEKEFWDSVPDWTSELGTNAERFLVMPLARGGKEYFPHLKESKTPQFRKNSEGKKIAMDSALGYNGFAKRISEFPLRDHPIQRIIYEVKNGWIVRFRSWNIEGLKISEGSYKEGKHDGIFSYWNPPGKSSESNYKDGIIHGPQTTWYPNNGSKKETKTYKLGSLDGARVHWFKNGQKSRESNYKNYKIDGLSTSWYENGQKRYVKFYEASDRINSRLIRADAWTSNGKKCMITNVRDGNGVFVYYSLNDEKHSHETYQNGYLHGKSIGWHEQGQILSAKGYKYRSEINYKDGNRSGLSTQWYENGHKKEEGNYTNKGRKNGLWSYWNEDGKMNKQEDFISGTAIKKIDFFDNGKKRSENNYDNLQMTFRGRRGGLSISWYENGQKKEEGKWKNGAKDGLFIKWYESGQKKEEINFKINNRSGLSTQWYENGYKKEEGNFTGNGRRNGLWSYWNEDGKMKEQLEFQSNWKSKTITFDGDGKKLSEIIHEILSPKVIKLKQVTPVEKNISSRTVTRPKIRPLKISTTETSRKIELNSQKITEAKKKLTEKRKKWIVDEKKRRLGEFLDQSQEGFTNGNVTSFSHLKNKNWSSFKAGKKGVLSTIELAWSTPPHESHFSGLYGTSMKGFIMEEDDENGTIVANWSISKDDLMMQFAGLKRAEQNWVIINVISNAQLQLGKTYYMVCENISEEKEWFGNFSFSDKNPYQDGRFWYNQNHDLMFRTYVKPAK